jgi:hypothetical protein
MGVVDGSDLSIEPGFHLACPLLATAASGVAVHDDWILRNCASWERNSKQQCGRFHHLGFSFFLEDGSTANLFSR